ncbi:MAG: hypothetical protein LUG99_01805 [Lachnospiraceae bacterium]|nr:hypothetical protein [Lachnospiraceae bacterium]
MSDLEVGQVLSLKIRFNNNGTFSTVRHPYLIVDIDREFNTVEIAQLDSLKGKEYKAAMKSNKVIYCDNPPETVIDKDSYVQLDNTFKLELYDELVKYRRQSDKLSSEKLNGAGKKVGVLVAYKNYHKSHEIDENKQVYMSKSELEDNQ